ncbi:DUF3995 domain-containing protein [Algimonas porphyrae]|uniref:DUF3995 domain-containing protein n=1 Tax=Algimonas porphyrae TaxID=1128113 RepID=UPI0024E18526|nr:DUF3995 domain-containing protein [Algimonas porphyrae]
MARTIGKTLFVVLSLIALLHVYWGFGGLWPTDNVRELIDLVIGDTRFEQMPPIWMTLIVACLIAAAGWVALEKSGVTSFFPKRLISLATWCLILVFALRGLSTYAFVSGLRETSPYASQAFQRYDAILYAPLCLLIAAGFLFLATRKTR